MSTDLKAMMEWVAEALEEELLAAREPAGHIAVALRASGEVPTTRHDRLCLELIHLDSARGGVALVRAGMAMRRILDSRDPRAYGAQARLVIHLHEAHADQEASDTNAMARGVGLAQEDMDALNGDELARVERLLEARAQITAEIEALVTAARSRGAQVRH